MSRRSSRRAAALACVALSVLLAGCGGSHDKSGEPAAANPGSASNPDGTGRTPPSDSARPDPYAALSAEDPHGRTLNFADFAGKVRLFDVWASWCGPCRMTIPELNSLYERYRGRGLVVIGISVDDNPAAVLEFQRQVPVRYPTVMFNPGLGKVIGEPSSIPTTFLVDRSGRLRRRFIGYIEAPTLEAEVRRFL